MLLSFRLSAPNAVHTLPDTRGGAIVIGPVRLGMAESVHMPQRGFSVQDVLNLATVVAVDWQARHE